MRLFTTALTLLLIGAALLFVSCGNSKNPNPNNLTSAQAQTLGVEVFDDAFSAIAGATGDSRSNTDRRSGWADLSKNKSMSSAAKPASSSGTYTYNCFDGGTITVSGTVGNSSLNVTLTPTSCNDGSLTFSGDPNITVSGTANDNGTDTSISVSIGGGISWTPDSGNTFPAGSCLSSMQINASVSDSTGALASCSISGKMCGYSLNYNCATE